MGGGERSGVRGSPPGKWLLIQLARFGDLLQTAPLASTIPAELHLLIDSSQAAAAKLLPNISRLLPVNRSDLLRSLLKDDFAANLTYWSDLVAELKREGYSRVVNITHTPESALIAEMGGAPDIRGARFDRKGLWSADPWENLFRASLSPRDWGAFHLVDLHSLSAGVSSSKPEAKSPAVDGELRIGLQLGANSPLRRWPVASFAETARRIAALLPVKFLLFGSKEEAPLAMEFIASAGVNSLDLTGKTAIDDLAREVDRCRLVISGDTGTIHLAAMRGIPSIGVFLGMARPDDTAPYLAGSVLIEPRTSCYPCPEHQRCGHLSCHQDIPLEEAAEAALTMLRGESPRPLDRQSCRRRVVSLDQDGFLTLQSGSETPRDAIRRTMRKIWLGEAAALQNGEGITLTTSQLDQLGTLHSAATAGASAATIFRRSLAGVPDRQALAALKETLTQIDNLSIDEGAAGLLARQTALGLERLPPDGAAASSIVGEALTLLAGRSRRLIESAGATLARGAA